MLKGKYIIKRSEKRAAVLQGQIMSELIEGKYFLVDVFDFLMGEHIYSKIIHLEQLCREDFLILDDKEHLEFAVKNYTSIN